MKNLLQEKSYKALVDFIDDNEIRNSNNVIMVQKGLKVASDYSITYFDERCCAAYVFESGLKCHKAQSLVTLITILFLYKCI